ncbi:hypothetical protein FIBSPDRAFT_931234 [Athelia psychrophila]|uniref:G domain-containing protein n=1 Tax=Athelia psychrophila TaxID=1759441 RepID=A0A166KTD0_9AGAM|nr:hypothetical protein FIBSPDRAFT_931234 [Fibularhizoctonia sp. CBS 109695]
MFRAQKVPGAKSSPADTPVNSNGAIARTNTQGTATAAQNESINIIVCGQAGVGKSSLINMLAGKTVAKTSSDAVGCTSKSDRYPITTPGDRKLTLWDTAGLDQWVTVPSPIAMQNLRERTTQLTASTGLSLVIYMMRGKPTENVINDYVSFKAFCDDQVAFVLVMTALDGVSDRAAWWSRNESHFHRAGIRSDGHACIVAARDDHNEEAYTESAKEVFKLIKEKAYLRDPWKADNRSIGTSKTSHSALVATPANGTSVNAQNTQNVAFNIIVCGQTGAGKSSLVNMLAGGPNEIARTSNDTIGCTLKSEPYPVTTPTGRKLTLWDTAGLEDGPTGRVSALEAMQNIRVLTLQLAASTGLSLIIYVVRGKNIDRLMKHYLLFKASCDDKVPFVLVVTGLDQESDRAGWWNTNESHFHQAGTQSDGHACIVATKDGHHKEAYTQSVREVFKLIETTCRPDPWKAERRSLFMGGINVVAAFLPSSKASVLYRELIKNDVEETEAKVAVKVYKLNIKSVKLNRAGRRTIVRS